MISPDVETSSADYASRFGGDVGRWFLQVQANAVLDLLASEPSRPLEILEVGGGHAQLTPTLLERGHRVCVQGSDPSCFRRLGDLADRNPGQLNTVVSDLYALPFADRRFDVVISLRLLSHVECWQSLLGEMGRVSRRMVMIDYASRCSVNLLAPALFRAKHRVEGNTRPFTCHTLRALRACMNRLGFGVIRLRKQFAAPMALHRAMDRRGLSERIEATCLTLGLTPVLGSPVVLSAERGATCG